MPESSPKSSGGIKQAHLHSIEIDELIVHRYSEHEALLKKADKIAREVIDRNLREGEATRVLKAGSYQLYFPKLTPDAGALRCAVIAEEVYREVRRANPASAAIDSQRQEDSDASANRSAAGPVQDTEDVRAENARRAAANRAMARMAEPSGIKEEIDLTASDIDALAALELVYQPVWHTKNNLITAYKCTLRSKGRYVSSRDAHQLLDTSTREVSNAKIDAHVYGHSLKAVQYLLAQGLKALLIVPIHFSTIDRLRFIGSFLDAGRGSDEAAKALIVFELIGLPANLTRFRLREPVGYLRTRARALMVRPGFEHADLEMYKEFGFHGVSVDLNDYDWAESRFIKSFEQFAINAETARLQSFVHGISSSSLAVGAVAAGITYMDGDAISDPVTTPARIRPFELDMLFEG